MEMSIREMRQQLIQLQVVLEKTPEIIIMRHGKPLARLLPMAKARRRPDHAKLRALQPRLRIASETMIRADMESMASADKVMLDAADYLGMVVVSFVPVRL